MSQKSRLFLGSINLDEVIKGIKTGKISTYQTDAGQRLVNVNIWLNAQPDNYDNDGSIQLQNKKEFKGEKKRYIGNFREYIPQEVQVDDSLQDEIDDLPF